MGTTLNKKAYTKLIDENIEELEKYMPEHSLEKRHIIDVLKWSIKTLYPSDGIFVKLNKADVIKSVCENCKVDLETQKLKCCQRCYGRNGEQTVL
jgi:hypothetical protein